MTVYKAIKKEADAAAKLAIALAKGEKPTATDATVDNDTKDVPRSCSSRSRSRRTTSRTSASRTSRRRRRSAPARWRRSAPRSGL